MTKVEEKLKAGRVKRTEGSGFNEEHQKKHAGTSSHPNKNLTTTSFSEYQFLILGIVKGLVLALFLKHKIKL